jgi:DNA-binding CsgD family transcriptional regulator
MTPSTTTLIERIYEAAIYPERWEAVFLDLAARFNSETAGMWVYSEDEASRVSKMVGAIDDAEMAFYNRNLAAQNPWYQIPGLMRPGCALTDTSIEVILRDPRAFTRTAFYQEWIKHLGLRIARFKQLWKLTNKEAQFADLLLRGLTVKEAAERLNMTFETARWYCKQAMHKIGVNRQSRLIATLLSNVLISGDTEAAVRRRPP